MFVVVVAAEAVVNGEGAPFSTTPQLAPPRKGATCHEQEHRIQRSFGGRWSNSFDQGRTPEELAKEFEPSAQAIRNWVSCADRDEGRRADGLTTAEREELRRLRREIRQLKIEREILAKAAAWFARETDSVPPKSSGS